MKKVLINIIMLFSLWGCVESDIVKDYTASEVEYILSQGAEKTWALTELIVDGERQSFETCSDSVYWMFQVVDEDSIASYEIRNIANCTVSDTVFAGFVSASVFDGIFTDSLLIEDGDLAYPSFMSVREVRASYLRVRYTQGGQSREAVYNNGLN